MRGYGGPQLCKPWVRSQCRVLGRLCTVQPQKRGQAFHLQPKAETVGMLQGLKNQFSSAPALCVPKHSYPNPATPSRKTGTSPTSARAGAAATPSGSSLRPPPAPMRGGERSVPPPAASPSGPAGAPRNMAAAAGGRLGSPLWAAGGGGGLRREPGLGEGFGGCERVPREGPGGAGGEGGRRRLRELAELGGDYSRYAFPLPSGGCVRAGIVRCGFCRGPG